MYVIPFKNRGFGKKVKNTKFKKLDLLDFDIIRTRGCKFGNIVHGHDVTDKVGAKLGADSVRTDWVEET